MCYFVNLHSRARMHDSKIAWPPSCASFHTHVSSSISMHVFLKNGFSNNFRSPHLSSLDLFLGPKTPIFPYNFPILVFFLVFFKLHFYLLIYLFLIFIFRFFLESPKSLIVNKILLTFFLSGMQPS